jgi:Zn-dependent protease with chaperone function
MAALTSDLLAELLLHGLIAVFVVEGLLHWLPVETPEARLPYRLTALVAPIVFLVAFEILAPFRREEWFRDVSVFVSARWTHLPVGGTNVRTLALLPFALGGATLLLRDLAHAAQDAWQFRVAKATRAQVEPPARVTAPVRELATVLGLPEPVVEVIASPAHTLHCRGWRQARLVISSGTLSTLTDDELRAALAHELGHVRHRDVLRGWLLLGLRSLQWFNPFAQAVGRRAAQEMEWRADDQAASLTGMPLALAHALVRCARRRGDRFLGLSGQGRLRTLEERCRRLMRETPVTGQRCVLEIALLWIGLAGLLVLVQ